MGSDLNPLIVTLKQIHTLNGNNNPRYAVVRESGHISRHPLGLPPLEVDSALAAGVHASEPGPVSVAPAVGMVFAFTSTILGIRDMLAMLDERRNIVVARERVLEVRRSLANIYQRIVDRTAGQLMSDEEQNIVNTIIRMLGHKPDPSQTQGKNDILDQAMTVLERYVALNESDSAGSNENSETDEAHPPEDGGDIELGQRCSNQDILDRLHLLESQNVYHDGVVIRLTRKETYRSLFSGVAGFTALGTALEFIGLALSPGLLGALLSTHWVFVGRIALTIGLGLVGFGTASRGIRHIWHYLTAPGGPPENADGVDQNRWGFNDILRRVRQLDTAETVADMMISLGALIAAGSKASQLGEDHETIRWWDTLAGVVIGLGVLMGVMVNIAKRKALHEGGYTELFNLSTDQVSHRAEADATMSAMVQSASAVNLRNSVEGAERVDETKDNIKRHMPTLVNRLTTLGEGQTQLQTITAKFVGHAHTELFGQDGSRSKFGRYVHRFSGGKHEVCVVDWRMVIDDLSQMPQYGVGSEQTEQAIQFSHLFLRTRVRELTHVLEDDQFVCLRELTRHQRAIEIHNNLAA